MSRFSGITAKLTEAGRAGEKMLSADAKATARGYMDKTFSAIGRPGIRRAEAGSARAISRGKRRLAMGAIAGGAYTMIAPPNPNSRRGIAQAGGRFGQGMGMSSGGSGMLNPRSSGGFA